MQDVRTVVVAAYTSVPTFCKFVPIPRPGPTTPRPVGPRSLMHTAVVGTAAAGAPTNLF
jgi:hypothetical protein